MRFWRQEDVAFPPLQSRVGRLEDVRWAFALVLCKSGRHRKVVGLEKAGLAQITLTQTAGGRMARVKGPGHN